MKKSTDLKNNVESSIAFVCYGDKDNLEDHEYGPKSASAAVEALNDQEIDINGEKVKLYVKPALKKEEREKEKASQ